MLTSYSKACKKLDNYCYTWLVTGASGFIGSNLTKALLSKGQKVIAFDNLSSGKSKNLNDIQITIGTTAWQRLRIINGDITNAAICNDAVKEVDYILHQAALGSVPRSIAYPMVYHECNVTGFVNMIQAANEAGVKRFVYASSSSVYGDSPDLPKVEEKTGRPLSPYALSKSFNEQYAQMMATVYGFPSIGLRYFNVFGPRQDPTSAYAAVIPKWVSALLKGETCTINGDGETSRDFCYVDNVVQANLLAALTDNEDAVNQVYNIAVGERTTLNQLYDWLCDELNEAYSSKAIKKTKPLYSDFRKGDIRHSLADISKARRLLGYEPTHTVRQGLKEAVQWYIQAAENAEEKFV
jgi:UDP-N-acetylglucosamine 4-epimerase